MALLYRTFNKLVRRNVGAFRPRFQRSPTDRADRVTRTVDFPAWNSATIEPLLTRQRFQTKNHLRKLVSRETQSEQIVFRVTPVAIRAAPLPSVSQALADPSPAPLAVCGRRPTLCAALALKDTNHQRERAARKRPMYIRGERGLSTPNLPKSRQKIDFF